MNRDEQIKRTKFVLHAWNYNKEKLEPEKVFHALWSLWKEELDVFYAKMDSKNLQVLADDVTREINGK